MPADFSKMSKEQLLELYNNETAARQAPQQPQAQPQIQQQPETEGIVMDALKKMSPALAQSFRGFAQGAAQNYGGGSISNDLQKFYQQEAIKKQFENYPNSLDYKKKEADLALTKERTTLAKAGYVMDENGVVTKAGKGGLTAGQERQQDALVEKIYTTREMNKAKGRMLDNALAGADTVPQGLTGKWRMGAAKAFPFTKGMVGVNDQQIQDSQEMKMALTMGTLAETAWTKGAISDSEMTLFKESSANDDFNNPAVIPVLKKIKAYMDAEEEGLYGAYQRNYGEDPRSWFGENVTQQPSANANQAPTLNPNQQASREKLRQKYGY